MTLSVSLEWFLIKFKGITIAMLEGALSSVKNVYRKKKVRVNPAGVFTPKKTCDVGIYIF